MPAPIALTMTAQNTEFQSITRLESNVRGYSRAFPVVFKQAFNATLVDTDGREYIDFLAGAGTLNYGHNNPLVKQALIDHLTNDGVMHGLDLATCAKIEFLETLDTLILKPRNLNYRVQFTGPTGTNAVEAAIKLARKQKKRSHVISFTNAYHGHSLGSLALTGNRYYHDEHYGSRNNVSFLPFDNYFGDGANTAKQLRTLLEDGSSGIPLPAAIIVETVQAEGGINVASNAWLQEISRICKDFNIAFIIDDIQSGNGRTGDFFSFESARLIPDIVCISKSIGGGLPLSLVLINPEMDGWQPGEHTGTFRGNQLAFVAGTALLKLWQEDSFKSTLKSNCSEAESKLVAIANDFDSISMRGRGMIRGLELPSGKLATEVCAACFTNGLIAETAGAQGEVVKFLAPLTIEADLLNSGMDILRSSIETVFTSSHNLKSGN